MKKKLDPLPNWFEGGGPHGISLGRKVARALGLSPEKHETGEVRLFAGEEEAGHGTINAHNAGRLSGVNLLFEKLDVHPNAMVPLEVSVEHDDLGKKLVFTITRTATPGYWALFANPETYRIDDAVRELQEDTWVTAGRPMRRGDRVVIWRGKGRGARRGVAALGEVVADPSEMGDAANPYWVTPPPAAETKPRVRVRYDVPPGLPLWLDEHDDVLGQLSVSRAKGGTVFNLTEEQWDTVVELAGGLPTTAPLVTKPLGRPYVNVGKLPPSERRDPFAVDPDKVDRGNQAHAETQDALADFLRSRGIAPLAPTADEPEFDLAWDHNGTIYVAEVKSVTIENEEKQLRLGLGQVLRYRQALMLRGRAVMAVLVPEMKPTHESWMALCHELGVVLVWPDNFDVLLARSAF